MAKGAARRLDRQQRATLLVRSPARERQMPLAGGRGVEEPADPLRRAGGVPLLVPACPLFCVAAQASVQLIRPLAQLSQALVHGPRRLARTLRTPPDPLRTLLRRLTAIPHPSYRPCPRGGALSRILKEGRSRSCLPSREEASHDAYIILPARASGIRPASPRRLNPDEYCLVLRCSRIEEFLRARAGIPWSRGLDVDGGGAA